MNTLPNYSPEDLALLKSQAEEFWASLSGIDSIPVGLPSQGISNLTVGFLGMTHDFDMEDTYGLPNMFLFNKGKGIFVYRTDLNPADMSLYFPQGLTVGGKVDMDFIVKGHQVYKGTTITLITQCAFYPASERPQIFKKKGELRSRIDFHEIPPPVAGQYKDDQLREIKIEQLNPKATLAVKPLLNIAPKRVVQSEQLKLF